MKFAAALFDLDGTLQDSEIHWILATQAFLNDNGLDFNLAATTALVYGRSSTEIYLDIAAMEPFRGRTIIDLASCIRDYYERMTDDGDISFPSSVALLKRMAQDMPVAIVSGSPLRDVKLAAHDLGVDGDVSLILGAEDVERGKPAPDCFLKAASILGVDPAKCAVFEDSTAGVAAAKAAGMFCVALVHSDRPPQDVSPADVVVNDLSEFNYP